jgi:hypothetical protein
MRCNFINSFKKDFHMFKIKDGSNNATLDKTKDATLDEGQKRKIDALQALLNYWWGEYQEKTKLEWKISLVIWALLATAIGGILTGKISSGTKYLLFGFPYIISILLIFILGVGHVMFLFWIQCRLKNFRDKMSVIRKGIEEALLIVLPQEKPYNILKHITFFLQLSVTIGACIYLISLILGFK